MDCTRCQNKICREGHACSVVNFDIDETQKSYEKEQQIVQSAAKLVDNGRAGTLSRLEEVVEYSKLMGFKKIGLAYCYGMEKDVRLIADYLRLNGFKVEAASCTVGGLTQNAVNQKSKIRNVSCNPIGQAKQLNSKNPNLTLTVGLCLGHDILFNRVIKSDTTNLVVKDRVHNHKPLEAIKNLELKIN